MHFTPTHPPTSLSHTHTKPQELPSLRQLDLLLQYGAWAKACAALGGLTQLNSLTIKGRPLDERAKHGSGSLTTRFWGECVAPLSRLTQLTVTPWIKAADNEGQQEAGAAAAAPGESRGGR